MVKREKYIKVMLSVMEYTQYDKYAKDNGFNTIARFVRESINNLINPKETNGLSKNDIIRIYDSKIKGMEKINQLLEEKYRKEIDLLEIENLKLKQREEFPSKLDETDSLGAKIEAVGKIIDDHCKSNNSSCSSEKIIKGMLEHFNIKNPSKKVYDSWRAECFDILENIKDSKGNRLFRPKAKGWIRDE